MKLQNKFCNSVCHIYTCTVMLLVTYRICYLESTFRGKKLFYLESYKLKMGFKYFRKILQLQWIQERVLQLWLLTVVSYVVTLELLFDAEYYFHFRPWRVLRLVLLWFPHLLAESTTGSLKTPSRNPSVCWRIQVINCL